MLELDPVYEQRTEQSPYVSNIEHHRQHQPVYRRQRYDIRQAVNKTGPHDTANRRQCGYSSITKDACTQTSESALLTQESGNQPPIQTLSKSKSRKSKFPKSHKSNSNPNSNPNSKSNSISESNSKSYTISSLNIPPENLLHCKFHIDGQPVTLLIDTGAAISVIRKDKIGKNSLDSSNTVSIIGVSNGNSNIRTHGTSSISLDHLPKHQFHVANLNIESDGILGNDFMTKFNVHIYIASKTMRILTTTYKLFYLSEEKKQTHDNNLFLPQRSEIVIACYTNDIQNGPAIVEKQEIHKDIIIPHSIVNVQNNKFLITCLNSSCHDKNISMPIVKTFLYSLNHFPINTINNIPLSHMNEYDILKLIRRDHLNREENESLDKIVSEFCDIFYIEGQSLSFTNHTKHSIPTTSNIPLNTKTYRFPFVHQQEVKTQVQKMLDQNIIQPSTSPWSSPIWVVPKKLDASGKQKWRVVIDYRKLNEITIGDSYPLPNIADILDKLGHSTYFTTLDLASGFHQIELQPEDIPKTAFNTPYGHYEFLRMPFGLKNAPATFQRAMDSVLYGLQGERCFVYLDDIVVFASSLREHEQKLTEVFSRLRKHGLKVQPDKCEFLRKEVAYLGHIISSEGVKPNPDKVKSVQEFPIPKSCKDIKSFLGLAGYYRRFIPNFSKITKPLTALLKKDIQFNWGSDQQQAFNTCKEILTTTPLLQYPDFNKEFLLTTDASIHAVGAVLSQGEIGKDLPIAYASRTLNKAETNYSTIERELLAIVWAVKHFRPYLFGRKFKIITDHKPLTWLFNIKDPGSRLVRWRLKLEEYDYEIVYKAGKNNTNADALSRPPVLNTNIVDLTNDDTNSLPEQNLSPNTKYSLYTTPESKEYLQINYEHFMQSNINYDTNKLKTSPDKLFDTCHKNIFIPISCQLSDQNQLYNEALSLCTDVCNTNHTYDLYDVQHIISNENQNLYFCYTRPSHFDPWDSENYFKALQSCLQQYEINTLHVPNLKFDNTCKLNGNEQLRITAYLAEIYNCNITICDNKIKYPSPEEIPKIIKMYHDEPLSGHRGIVETIRKIRDEYFWKGMSNDIKTYIESCITCQRNKIQRKSYQAPMVITSQSTEPFERVSMDLVSYSDISDNNNKYVLTLQDELTRFVQAYPIPDKEAVTVAKQLLHFCQHYGVPKRFHSDQGTEFMNNVIKQLTKFLGANQTFNTAYHPQSNGALERFHATLRDHIRMYHSRKLRNWDHIVPLAIICHNTSLNQSTGYTPHELLFGYKPRQFYSLKPIPDYTACDYLKDLNERLRISRDTALRNIETMKEKAKERYDRQIKNIAQYRIGSQVMLRVPNPNNLDSKWDGPYQVIRVGFNENYLIRKSNRTQLVHANRLRPFSAQDTV